MLRPIDVLRRYPAHDFTLGGLLASRCAAGGERPFIVEGAKTWSYADFAASIEPAARVLIDAGASPGARVGVMAPTSATFAIAVFAIARLGCQLVPINPELRFEEARAIVVKSRPAVILHASELAAAASALAAASVPPARTVAIGLGAGEFGDFARRPSLPPGYSSPRPDATCLVLFTSGTTGTPKGVMHAQRNFVAVAEAFVERQWLQPTDRMLCILPMFHINALFYSLGGALVAGATLVLGGKFSASRFWPLVRDSGATQVNLLGAIAKILSLRPRSEFVPGTRLNRVYSAPMPRDVHRVFREEFGVRWVAEGYGMSEIPGILAQPYGVEPQALGTMGRVCRHPDGHALGELRIVDAAFRDVKRGEQGTLLARTELIMQGYFEEAERTRAVFHEGFFITGDVVRQDADGNYVFVARDKDLIRRRGENISAIEIDHAAAAHPAVSDAAAVAVPAELGEDDILLAVVARAGAKIDAGALRDFLSTRLAAVKLPRFIVAVDALPYGPTQRIQRFKLAQDSSLRARAVDFDRRGVNP